MAHEVTQKMTDLKMEQSDFSVMTGIVLGIATEKVKVTPQLIRELGVDGKSSYVPIIGGLLDKVHMFYLDIDCLHHYCGDCQTYVSTLRRFAGEGAEVGKESGRADEEDYADGEGDGADAEEDCGDAGGDIGAAGGDSEVDRLCTQVCHHGGFIRPTALTDY